MNGLLRISKEFLPHLRDIYRTEWPLHAVSYAAIDHFIRRFEKHAQWEEKVKFWTLNNDWRITGTFAMVNDNDQHILFNTLESYPYPTLRRTLELLDYEQEKVFICFNDIFRPVVLDVMRVNNLESTFDSGSRITYWPREKLDLEIAIEPPEGFHFDSLNQSHVQKINSVWAQRHSSSEKFLSNLIEYNITTGLFDSQTGELVAWCLMLETGAMGNLQVDKRYENRKFGTLTYITQMFKMARENYPIIGHIVHQNKKSFNMVVTKGGQEWIGNNSWIGVRKKESLTVVPLWGHL